MLQESQILINQSTHAQFFLYTLLEIFLGTEFGGGLYPITIPNSLWSYFHVLLFYFYLTFETNPDRFILWFERALWCHLPIYLLVDVLLIIVITTGMADGGFLTDGSTNEQIIFILIAATLTITFQSV